MLASTAACDLTDLYGVEEDKPLPGERIPVMQLDSTLQADPRLEELDVRLPAPWANADWPQVGGYPSHAMHHLALGEQIADLTQRINAGEITQLIILGGNPNKRPHLLHLGNAHTHGDVFVWLPKQRILFSGDACVNGPYNYMGDGNSIDWLKTLDAAKALKPKIMCPGHGGMATASLIDDQKTYFTTLHHLVKPFTSKKGGQQMLSTQTELLRKQVMKNQQIARYVGDKFHDQLQKIFGDYTGQTLGRLDVQKKAAEEEEK